MSRIQRIVAALLGVVSAAVGIFLLLLFIANELTEMESMPQYHGHVTLGGAMVGVLVVVGIGGVFGYAAFWLLRTAFRPKISN